MTEIERLEEEVYRLRNKREDIEAKKQQVMRVWEEEDDNILYAYRKLEDAWESYGKQDAEFAALLEEEKAFMDKHKAKLVEYGEQTRNELLRELDEIDREVNDKQTQMHQLTVEKEKGDT